jgi:signal transduction histidine kinase
VRQIVEAHGGEVGAQSAAGRTEIWFRLPTALVPGQEATGP